MSPSTRSARSGQVRPSIEITNPTKARLPRLPFLAIKEKVLGKKYELSLVFVGPKKITELNKKYRNKNKPTDILSFPLTENSGEIYICLPEVKSHAKIHGHPPTGGERNYAIYLFIHGLLHLKGLDHGSRMEREEKKFCLFFGIGN